MTIHADAAQWQICDVFGVVAKPSCRASEPESGKKARVSSWYWLFSAFSQDIVQLLLFFLLLPPVNDFADFRDNITTLQPKGYKQKQYTLCCGAAKNDEKTPSLNSLHHLHIHTVSGNHSKINTVVYVAKACIIFATRTKYMFHEVNLLP